MHNSKTMSVTRKTRLAAVVLAIAAATSVAVAHIPTDIEEITDLRAALESADAVMHGVVTDVRYRNSTRHHDNEESLPHTFVTYTIHDRILGDVSGDKITLRFLGGPDGRGRFLLLDAPLFNVGHEDVLFISGNGQSECPLVNCEHGRFRVYQGGVYTNAAIPVTRISDAQVVTGVTPEPALLTVSFPRPEFAELLKNPEAAKLVLEMVKHMAPKDIAELKKRYEAEAPEHVEFTRVPEEPSQDTDEVATEEQPMPILPDLQPAPIEQRAMPIDAFVQALKGIIPTLSPRDRPLVTSVDPNRPFMVQTPRVDSPQSETVSPITPRAETDEERAEREIFERQNFDPVIKRHRP
jgi:hypothetical protein